MPSLRTVGSCLTIRSGGGWGSLFGVPFLAAGLWTAGQVLSAIHTGGTALTAMGGPLMALVALVFIATGGTLVFGRRWMIIDSGTRVVLKRWGWLWPMYTQRHELSDFTLVTFGLERGDSDSPDRFPVALASMSGAQLVLGKPTGYAEARSWASSVAAHLNLPIEDRSTDHVTRLTAAQANQPFIARTEARWIEADEVSRPPDARSDVRFDGHTATIRIPRPRRHPTLAWLQLIPVAAFVWWFVPLGRLSRDLAPSSGFDSPLAWVLIILFCMLPAVVVVSALLRSHVGHTIVTVSPTQGVEVAERRRYRTQVIASIPPDAVLDVDFSTDESARAHVMRTTEDDLRARGGPHAPQAARSGARYALEVISRFARSRGVIVKGRDGLTAFGHHLDDAEVRYLHSVVRRTLLGRY